MKDLSQQATKVVDLYKGEEKGIIFTKNKEDKYGVCVRCGYPLSVIDSDGMHSDCAKEMYGI